MKIKELVSRLISRTDMDVNGFVKGVAGYYAFLRQTAHADIFDQVVHEWGGNKQPLKVEISDVEFKGQGMEIKIPKLIVDITDSIYTPVFEAKGTLKVYKGRIRKQLVLETDFKLFYDTHPNNLQFKFEPDIEPRYMAAVLGVISGAYNNFLRGFVNEAKRRAGVI